MLGWYFCRASLPFVKLLYRYLLSGLAPWCWLQFLCAWMGLNNFELTWWNFNCLFLQF
jgi:hypothetical protein